MIDPRDKQLCAELYCHRYAICEVPYGVSEDGAIIVLLVCRKHAKRLNNLHRNILTEKGDKNEA